MGDGKEAVAFVSELLIQSGLKPIEQPVNVNSELNKFYLIQSLKNINQWN